MHIFYRNISESWVNLAISNIELIWQRVFCFIDTQKVACLMVDSASVSMKYRLFMETHIVVNFKHTYAHGAKS